MTLEKALPHLREGKRIARKGWIEFEGCFVAINDRIPLSPTLMLDCTQGRGMAQGFYNNLNH